MERVERFYKIIRLLRARGVVPTAALRDELGISPATFKRDLEYLRDRLDAPIAYDRERGGYVLDEPPGSNREYLPGLWFSAGEVHALLTLYTLAASLEPTLIGEHLKPLIGKLEKQLEGEGLKREALTRRIRILHMAHRPPDAATFEAASIATLGRRQLKVLHFKRSTGERLQRTLSPQRLVHYRDNWYLDAWCHSRGALRTFALDAIEQVELLDAAAKAVPELDLNAHYASAFGIFGGHADKVAVLRFTPARSRWVVKERWHPEQTVETRPDGSCVLRLPYRASTELVMDVLRHGAEVEVLEPAALRDEVASALKAAAALY